VSARRARRLLLAALALSLLIHLFFAGYLQWPAALQAYREREVIVRHVTIARIVPRTPPPPASPRPLPPRPAAASSRNRIAPPQIAHRGTRGLAAAAVPPAPVASSTPAYKATPSPKPSQIAGACVRPDASPAVASSPSVAEIPPDVRAAKASGTAVIAVSLDVNGRVIKTAIAQSSGNTGLDRSALQMAQSATYAPKLVGCKAAPADYDFTVKFVAW